MAFFEVSLSVFPRCFCVLVERSSPRYCRARCEEEYDETKRKDDGNEQDGHYADQNADQNASEVDQERSVKVAFDSLPHGPRKIKVAFRRETEQAHCS